MLHKILKKTPSLRLRFHGENTAATVATATSIPTPTVADSSDPELTPEHINEAVRVAPSLAAISPELWRRTHVVFCNHGLPMGSFLRIVTSNPAILVRPPHKIIEQLEIWRSCQFGEKLLHLLLAKYPELLDVKDGHGLLTQITYLKGFACTNKNVWQLLMNCPNLLEQSEERIEQKLEYLQKVMRIEIPEIVKSEALGKSLQEIRSRHTFLERLGRFKPRPLKMDPDHPIGNNRLYQITDTSAKTFATKICHVSLEEYEAFDELFERELRRKHRAFEEDDDDDQLSNDDFDVECSRAK